MEPDLLINFLQFLYLKIRNFTTFPFYGIFIAKHSHMSGLFTQITNIHAADPTLSYDDISQALGVSVQQVRIVLAAPTLEDIPALLTISKQIAFDPAAPARTRQGAIEFLVDELKGRNDARHKNLEANSELTTRMIATLECAQHAVPDSMRLRRQLNVTPTTLDA